MRFQQILMLVVNLTKHHKKPKKQVSKYTEKIAFTTFNKISSREKLHNVKIIFCDILLFLVKAIFMFFFYEYIKVIHIETLNTIYRAVKSYIRFSKKILECWF